MTNSVLKKQFSERLKGLMLQRGYSSNSSATGVKTSSLRNGIGTSAVMALRYVNGSALPDIETAQKIANWLKVNPGYLLFGKEPSTSCDNELIKIDKKLLEYALDKVLAIIAKSSKKTNILGFFISILSDLSSLEVDINQHKAIFDLALKSSLSLVGETAILENSQLLQDKKTKAHY